jgi:hypothetical protein
MTDFDGPSGKSDGQSGLGFDRFEQLDGVAGWVFHHDLLAADARNDLVAKF